MTEPAYLGGRPEVFDRSALRRECDWQSGRGRPPPTTGLAVPSWAPSTHDRTASPVPGSLWTFGHLGSLWYPPHMLNANRPMPVPDESTEGFWEAARRGVLALQHCP